MLDFFLSFHPGLMALSYVIAVAGSFVALQIAGLLFRSEGKQRWQLILMGAGALGGVGIWCMHFIGMLAWRAPAMATYDGLLTFASLVLVMVVVAIGLSLLTIRRNTPMILLAGVIAGIGVAGMHYTGMAAMQVPGELVHDHTFVAISIVIAIVASAAAFWLALNTTGGAGRFGAALIMGLAVCGMHYTGMAGASVEAAQGTTITDGYLPPLVLAIMTTVMAVVFMIFSAAFFLNRWLSDIE